MYSNDYVQKINTSWNYKNKNFIVKVVKHSYYCHICNYKTCICCTCILPCEHTSLSIVTSLIVVCTMYFLLVFICWAHIFINSFFFQVIYWVFLYLLQMAKPQTQHYLMPMTEPTPPLIFQLIRVRNQVIQKWNKGHVRRLSI